MTVMGKHSPPLNGTLMPFTIPPSLQPRGPVSVLPSRTVPDRSGLFRDVDGDTAIRVLAAAVVLAVAAFAAVVSYSHIFELGRHHGQDGTAARLLPLSVDGLIAAASLVMLHAARRSQSVPSLARAMLALGVAATIAANIFYGLPFGWLAAVVSAWPAVAFVGSVEMAVRFVRDARQGDTAADQPVVTPRHDRPPAAPKPRKRAPALSGRDRAAAIMKAEPGLTNAVVAKRAGVDVRTVQRARNDPAKS